ncbi:LuxR C-terminal-related transcriptional regulator [Cohnella sp. WQ 127256]|uniref:helix-turn-helix transcriptional regulator n=1 Tax=Cohnella sp. WQ 127256 TaxID=2938790 RepID=UPI0021174D9D|nr:LuxR C-terminal-related transcriptional regulator [Cohnella sp. WQ 127256]
MSKEIQHRRIINRVDHIEQHFLVGRENEIQQFQAALAGDTWEGVILNVYGTGGVGKTYLLNEFRRMTESGQMKFLLLDTRVFPKNPAEFCLHVLGALRYPLYKMIEQAADLNRLVETCLGAILESSQSSKMVLALDTFEEIGEMENWLRDEFLAKLNLDILVVICSRTPLQGGWLSSPAWRQYIYRMPLADLDYNSVKQYLERSGIEQDELIRRIWNQTKGHPLTLTLIVSTVLVQSFHHTVYSDDKEHFTYIVNNWLTEVPSQDMRALVEAVAVLRLFNQEILSFVMEKEVSTESFQRLVQFSFVQRVDRGWLLHDLLREAIHSELRLRKPENYNRLWKRCVLYYYEEIKKSARNKAISWHNAEWFYYIGDQLIQSVFYQQSVSYSSEPLSSTNRAEAEQYMINRHLHAKDISIKLPQPNAGEQMEYLVTREDSLYALKHIDLEELFLLDPNSVKLTRDPQGVIRGLAVIIPINEHTLDYLRSKPLSSVYFNSLPESELKKLRVPKHSQAGYFFKTLDTIDYSDLPMLRSTGMAFITHMLASGFVVAAPPPHPFSHGIFQSLGCERTDVVHYDYDDKTPTPLFVVDTRGSKLQRYLNKMVESFGILEERNQDEEPLLHLTPKENTVLELIVKGYSNLEIAKHLFLSETTVKKHISNIYRKLDVNKRVQLINKYPSMMKNS